MWLRMLGGVGLGGETRPATRLRLRASEDQEFTTGGNDK